MKAATCRASELYETVTLGIADIRDPDRVKKYRRELAKYKRRLGDVVSTTLSLCYYGGASPRRTADAQGPARRTRSRDLPHAVGRPEDAGSRLRARQFARRLEYTKNAMSTTMAMASPLSAHFAVVDSAGPLSP